MILCFRFFVFLADGELSTKSSKLTGWTHIVLKYIGPNNGQGVRIYYDRVQVANDTSKWSSRSYLPREGRIVVGRLYTDHSSQYATVMVDELIFFNQALKNLMFRYFTTK